MSCPCQQQPCSGSPACSSSASVPVTKCDRYVPLSKNVWVERGDSPNDVTAPGVCMLDTMSECQIIYVLERDPQARADLKTVTSDPALLALADSVPMLPTVEETDVEQALLNQPNSSGSIPLYSIFRGQPPFAQ